MAEDKKRVIVYADWMVKFEMLKDAEAGRLIKHFFRYINDLHPKFPDRITELSFIDIQNTLKRDLKKWEKRAESSRENGKSGGRPINPNKPKETNQVISEPRKPVSVSVNVNDNVNVKEINSLMREGEFNFDFVEPNWMMCFSQWIEYKKQIKKPFKIQQSVEACYKELKAMSENNLLNAVKIIQYSISNEYLSLCNPIKNAFENKNNPTQKVVASGNYGKKN